MIGVPYFDKKVGLWTIRIIRRNGDLYYVRSEEKQSVEEYREEYLDRANQRRR